MLFVAISLESLDLTVALEENRECRGRSGANVGAVGIETASLTSKSHRLKALPVAPQSNC